MQPICIEVNATFLISLGAVGHVGERFRGRAFGDQLESATIGGPGASRIVSVDIRDVWPCLAAAT